MENETVEHVIICTMCEVTYPITLPVEGLAAWQSGTLIQHEFPELSADTRELLISRTCGSCFNKMFAETETA